MIMPHLIPCSGVVLVGGFIQVMLLVLIWHEWHDINRWGLTKHEKTSMKIMLVMYVGFGIIVIAFIMALMLHLLIGG